MQRIISVIEQKIGFVFIRQQDYTLLFLFAAKISTTNTNAVWRRATLRRGRVVGEI
jgi:hypothetical protein